MKKLVSLILAILMLAGIMAIPAMAADDVSVYLFGEKLEFDVPAQIINGRTMVPMRKIFEELGATVEWDKVDKRVTSVLGNKKIELIIDSYVMYVNDITSVLDVAPCIIDGRTLVPVRAISESFNLDVEWDKNTKSVRISQINPLDTDIVGTVGGSDVSLAYVNFMYDMVAANYEQYQQYYGEDWLELEVEEGITFREMIDYEVSNTVIMLEVVRKIAKDTYGITEATAEKTVSTYINGIISSVGGREEYESIIKGMGTSEKAVKNYYTLLEIMNLLVEKTAQDGKVVYVPEEEAEMVFNQYYSNKVKVQHILVKDEDTALEVVKNLKNGADFSSLIDFYNTDPGQTPDGYYVFGDGEMVEEFETASKNLAVGAFTTNPVQSAYGYHIIKRYPLDKTSQEYSYCRQEVAKMLLEEVLIKEMQKTQVEWK